MRPETKREIREWVKTLAIALALALFVRTFIVAAFKIPSGSMRPTLMEGDKIFVNKFIYRFREPERGDVIVFKYPVNPKKDYVKRLIAFGGEEVEIRKGKILINGEVVHNSSIAKVYYYNGGDYGGEFQRIVVPEGSLYVLGDNSVNSMDSRVWGFLSRKKVVGRAFLIWWPPRRIRMIK